MKYHQ